MSQPYLGEIRLFGGNFAVRGNAMCNGQLMSISQNAALFSLLGTTFGGDGVQTFGLPDFRGRLPIDWGQGNGLSNYNMGQQVGTESVTLNLNQLPMHTHAAFGSSTAASVLPPLNSIPATLAAPSKGFWVQDAKRTGNPIAMSNQELQQTGGNQAHENRMPALAVTMMIALEGIFPSRN